jgi:hypothetical protein
MYVYLYLSYLQYMKDYYYDSRYKVTCSKLNINWNKGAGDSCEDPYEVMHGTMCNSFAFARRSAVECRHFALRLCSKDVSTTTGQDVEHELDECVLPPWVSWPHLQRQFASSIPRMQTQ